MYVCAAELVLFNYAVSTTSSLVTQSCIVRVHSVLYSEAFEKLSDCVHFSRIGIILHSYVLAIQWNGRHCGGTALSSSGRLGYGYGQG